ncbi:MAG: glycine cleavage system aminomethyltransferase GcvT [Deltaproteobacteria bacterium]
MRRTPLYDAHREAGARFTEFGGWEMPVQYAGLLGEHAAVREFAGLFDVSHMGEFEIRGPAAMKFCLSVATNDASRLVVGKAQYTLLCTEEGGVIDDTILYRLGEERFLLCVNAGNREPCADWLGARAEGFAGVSVTDRSDELGLIALQGPRSVALISEIGAAALADLPRFGVAELEVAGIGVIAARTGYTGEDGFEFFVPAASAASLWGALLSSGESLGVQPIGLGARDTLRLEAALPLYGHELGRDISPLEAGLGWAVKEARGGFPGAIALAKERAAGPARRLIGLRLTERGIGRAGYPVHADDRLVGVVTSGTKAPTLGNAVALALVAADSLKGNFAVEVRGRKISAERVDLPFYRRQ